MIHISIKKKDKYHYAEFKSQDGKVAKETRLSRHKNPQRAVNAAVAEVAEMVREALGSGKAVMIVLSADKEETDEKTVANPGTTHPDVDVVPPRHSNVRKHTDDSIPPKTKR